MQTCSSNAITIVRRNTGMGDWKSFLEVGNCATIWTCLMASWQITVLPASYYCPLSPGFGLVHQWELLGLSVLTWSTCSAQSTVLFSSCRLDPIDQLSSSPCSASLFYISLFPFGLTSYSVICLTWSLELDIEWWNLIVGPQENLHTRTGMHISSI